MKGSLRVAQFIARQKPFLVDFAPPKTTDVPRYGTLVPGYVDGRAGLSEALQAR